MVEMKKCDVVTVKEQNREIHLVDGDCDGFIGIGGKDSVQEEPIQTFFERRGLDPHQKYKVASLPSFFRDFSSLISYLTLKGVRPLLYFWQAHYRRCSQSIISPELAFG